jgi:hypothetical protein
MRTIIVAALAAAILSGAALAQSAKTFRTRLSPVPMTTAMASTIAGVGSVTAVLNGRKLTVNGTFEGLRTPATFAKIHRAKPGMRGPAILDLSVVRDPSGTAGTISASLDLTAQQVADLEQKWLYVQLHSEKAPDGNLWGWLFPQEKGR